VTQYHLDFDLSEATAKGLNRLRRDDLVKLCESKNLSTEGTKVKLVNTLIEWRDRHYTSDSTSVASSPSSTTTVRASGTPRTNGTTKAAKPVLFRSSRIHTDEPITPIPGSEVINDPGNGKVIAEPEVELDLESLGLEDKEIDYHRLTKLEKIGSGGFKEWDFLCIGISELIVNTTVSTLENCGRAETLSEQLKLLLLNSGISLLLVRSCKVYDRRVLTICSGY
jgi:hypothetical protein